MLSVLSDIYLLYCTQPMENSIKHKVVAFLKQVGLDDEQASVYLYLQEAGSSSVLAISRGLKTGRTKLYPALEEMVEKQVVSMHDRHYGTTYEALPPENLGFLVSEYERKVSALRHNLTATVHALNGVRSTSPSGSKVLEYRGVNGLKQILWNQTKAKDSYKVFELEALSGHSIIGKHFADKMHSIEKQKNLQTFDLTNNKARTVTIDEIDPKRNHFAYIDPAVFRIEFETLIYNNVVALLSYENNDIFGVEIYNEKLARQQEQLFDLLWSQAKRL